ncbi:MarR family winged helix-turn-helix transcriptional regulator [Brachybacterium hainanense]|uniref:MarR family winged helix-turn-helix transcriptional regulator n=1 Tax=Brachybacterium hainanense TaxID=1541174 RepID=A0ABV6RGN6_9MICO
MTTPDPALALVLACSQFTRLSTRRADVGVASVPWRITSTLQRRGEMRLSEIAAHEQVSRPTATTAIQRLEAEGIVSRRRDPQDARSSLVDLTPYGLTRLTAWRESLTASVAELLADIPEEDRTTLEEAAGILRRIIDTSEGTSPRA